MNGKYENKLKYTKPLDLLFSMLEDIFSSVVPEFRRDQKDKIESKSNLEQSHQKRIEKIFNSLNSDELSDTLKSKERQVVSFFLRTILRIQELTTVDEREIQVNKEMILISLYDLKIFNVLVTFLVIDGIHSCLPRGVGVPVGLRTKQFGLTIFDKSAQPSEELSSDSLAQLKEIVDTIVSVLKIKGDVRDLLLLGPYTADFVSSAAVLAFNNKIPEEMRKFGITAFNFIQRQIDTYSLYLHLSSLIRPKTPAWFVGGISHSLAILPLQRSDGVKSLLEFVSGSREKDEIQLSDLDRATRILKSVPRNVPVDTYSLKVGTQFVKIISSPSSNIAIPALQIITALYSQRPEIINLGLKKVLENRLNPSINDFAKSESVIVPQEDLDTALICLYLIVTKSHSDDLIESFTQPIFLPLWSLVCYLTLSKRSSELATSLLVSILLQNKSKTGIYVRLMSENLLIKNYSKFWKFAPSPNGGAEVRHLSDAEVGDLISTLENASLSGNISNVFDEIEVRVKKFTDVLDLTEDSDISSYFVSLLGEWLTDHESTDPFRALTATRLLEAILEKSKKKLLRSPEDIISVVYNTLEDFVTSLKQKLNLQKPKIKLEGQRTNSLHKLVSINEPDSDDEDANEIDSDDEGETNNEGDSDEKEQIVQLCFSLISAILMELDADTENTNKNSTITHLKLLLPSIAFIQKYGPNTQIKSQARKSIAKLDLLRSDSSLPESGTKAPSHETFLQAMQLMEDSSPPIQAHGMHMLKTLIEKMDKNVEFRLAFSLYLEKLQDKDSFIYLNAIKGLEALAGRYRFKVVDLLLESYKDQKTDQDVRLRIGEVLLKFIDNYGLVLQIDQTNSLIDTFLSVVARHGNVEDNDLSRMSAMSILSSFFDVAPAVAGPRLDDVLDCAIQILVIEIEPSKNIMRRSAISLIASLIQGSRVLNITPKDLASIRLRLEIASRDEDPLVRSQASTAQDMMEEIYSI